MMVLLSGFSNLFDFKLYTWDDDPQWHDIHIFHLLAQPPNTKMTCQLHLRRFTSWASLTVPWGKLQKIGSSGTLRFKLQFRTIWSTLVWGTFPTFPRIDGFWCEDADVNVHVNAYTIWFVCAHKGKPPAALQNLRGKKLWGENAEDFIPERFETAAEPHHLNIWFDDLTPLTEQESWPEDMAISMAISQSSKVYRHRPLPWAPYHFKFGLPGSSIYPDPFQFSFIPIVAPWLPRGFPMASPWLPHCLRTRWSTSIPSNSFPSEAVAACASVPRLTSSWLP